jgi:hypothetical protein
MHMQVCSQWLYLFAIPLIQKQNGHLIVMLFLFVFYF